ncbi:signal recognition particle-docking protein FtsY [Kribbella solani]|uniref:signal recognition particle-docking protein FtsY n=1 Tax=Kribbella solani TaxID=236067 RepID=UPI0029A88191|nr:signal recognition particle-docking protein FtsY [Kribbella solani]MDX3002267.1 signal recognition particle-docking protein FtsY [Kribbella solani]
MLTPLLVSLLTDQALITIVVAIAVVLVVGTTGLVVARRRRAELPSATKPSVEAGSDEAGSDEAGSAEAAEPRVAEPQVGDDAGEPRDTPTRTLEDAELPEPATPTIEKPESAQGRLVRLRARLARSQGSLGKGLLALLSRDKLDEEAWEDIETTLITADVGVAPTQELVEKLRTRMRVEGVGAQQAREILREELIALVNPSLDRSLKVSRKEAQPAVVLVVGVNGTGKTTTVGRLARVLVAEDKHVVLGAADTFRAAAADQLQTWGERVGARTVRGPEGGDPASIAFDSVKEGIAEEADVVLVDTAGRLHTKTGLMDELGKVKRVIEKSAEVDEVLLVIDATTGQNGLTQARVFAEVIDVTGLVLTKLDGTAKGGIVIAVQRELGVPVKLVGLGEGADDLAPFDAEQFVDALLD